MGWSSELMRQRGQQITRTSLQIKQRNDALRAVRDCGVIRAHYRRPGFHDLAMDGYATTTRVDDSPGWSDYRLTEKGKALAEAEL